MGVSVLGSLGTYYFSIFKAPIKVIKVLESIRRKFLWGAADDRSKISWVEWNMLLAPKSSGGWGIGSLKALNISLLTKWLWRMKTNPDGGWAMIIRAIHTRRDGDMFPLKRSITGVWKNILSVNKDLNAINLSLCNLFQTDGNSVRWTGDDSNAFTVRNFRYIIDKRMLPTYNTLIDICKWIPAKVSFFAWCASMDKIPTKINLLKRNVMISSSACQVCLQQLESADHLLLNCPTAVKTWELVMKWCSMNFDISRTVAALLRFKFISPGSKIYKKMGNCIIMVTLWCLWKARNERVFKAKIKKPEHITQEIIMLSHLWIKNRGKKFHIEWQSWCNFNVSF